MKSSMKWGVVLIVVLGVIGCGSNASKPMEVNISTELVAKLSKQEQSAVLETYLRLKDALVESDQAKAKTMALQLRSVSTSSDQLLNLSDKLAQASDLEGQRKVFYELSELLYVVMKQDKTVDGEIFVQFCPMAFENKGAFWFSNEKEVMNPYFGNQMLHCGYVKEEMK